MYVIIRLSDAKYVARQGNEHSYTNKLQHAQTFPDRDSAKRDCCGNETIISLEQAMGCDR